MNAPIHQLVADNLDLWTSATQRKSGAGRGGGKRISLYGIERLRALIFDLAAAGRLVAGQNQTVETLGKHVELVMGQAPPGNACNTDGLGTVFVKTGEFGPLYPEICEWTTKPLKMAKSGDVLICVVGATIGKLNLAIDCAIGRSVAAIRPKKSLDTTYLYYALMPFTLRLRVGARGSAQGVIGKAELNAVAMRIPPLAEQRRIVAKVDELMALCDALERESADAMAAHQALVAALLATLVRSANAAELATNWARLEQHFDTLFTTEASIDALKQTILDLAVRGKLVEQDAADEAVRLPSFRQVSISSDWDEKVFQHGKVQVILPDGWKIAPLAQVSSHIVDCPHTTPKWTETGELCVRTNQIKSRLLDLSQPNYVSGETYVERIERLEPSEGDILYIREGGILGVGCRIPNGVKLCLGQRSMLVRCASVVSSYYLEILINSPFIVGLAAHWTTGGAAPRVNMSTVRGYPIPIPPLAEQHRIVAKVDALMAHCDALKARITDAATTQKHLADAIVERAAA